MESTVADLVVSVAGRELTRGDDKILAAMGADRELTFPSREGCAYPPGNFTCDAHELELFNIKVPVEAVTAGVEITLGTPMVDDPAVLMKGALETTLVSTVVLGDNI
jgi:hypothetical protein